MHCLCRSRLWPHEKKREILTKKRRITHNRLKDTKLKINNSNEIWVVLIFARLFFHFFWNHRNRHGRPDGIRVCTNPYCVSRLPGASTVYSVRPVWIAVCCIFICLSYFICSPSLSISHRLIWFRFVLFLSFFEFIFLVQWMLTSIACVHNFLLLLRALQMRDEYFLQSRMETCGLLPYANPMNEIKTNKTELFYEYMWRITHNLLINLSLLFANVVWKERTSEEKGKSDCMANEWDGLSHAIATSHRLHIYL